jgi:uncharacterized protein (TIGR01244 family)
MPRPLFDPESRSLPMQRLLFVLVASLSASSAAAQQFTRAEPIATLGAPAVLDTAGMFQARFVQVGDDVFIGGQPTERALRELKARGVTTVVNLRTPEEMRRIGFDEEALVRELGMRYVYIPMRGTSEFPYAPSAITQLADALRTANGKVLLHCTIAWRASHLWGAYLIQERGVPVDQVLAHTRAINLMDDHRMTQDGRQPLELFLGRTVPGLGRPSHRATH